MCTAKKLRWLPIEKTKGVEVAGKYGGRYVGSRVKFVIIESNH